MGNEGLEPLISIMERKLLANLRVTTTSFWIAAIPVAVAFLIFLARYPTRPLAEARSITLQAGVTSALVAGVLGSLVNDSGAIVGGVTLTVIAVALAWLALKTAGVPPPPVPAATEPVPPVARRPGDLRRGRTAGPDQRRDGTGRDRAFPSRRCRAGTDRP